MKTILLAALSWPAPHARRCHPLRMAWACAASPRTDPLHLVDAARPIAEAEASDILQ
jgi:hypothetical protein